MHSTSVGALVFGFRGDAFGERGVVRRSPERAEVVMSGGSRMRSFRRTAVLAVSALTAAIGLPGAAASSAPLLSHRVVMRVAANASQNWSGYNQGSQALGGVM